MNKLHLRCLKLGSEYWHSGGAPLLSSRGPDRFSKPTAFPLSGVGAAALPGQGEQLCAGAPLPRQDGAPRAGSMGAGALMGQQRRTLNEDG